MGHDIGDHVLCATADRLRAIAPEAVSVGRFASDKFVVVVTGADEQATTELGDLVRAAVSEPIDTEDYRLVLTASVGISRGPLHGTTAQDLLQRAEAAMVSAKWLGGDTTFQFSTEQMRDIEERLQLGRRLRDAVTCGDLELHYQPQHRAADGALIGVEALLRWTDAEWGQVPPDRFIPIAETVGLMPEIGHWVLNEACRQARAWLDAGRALIPIAVNISAQELRRAGLVERVQAALQRYSLPADAITIELTESTLMENVERATATMHELTALGTEIALDDFGTGYSSLAYIKHFPISRIKIDKSFVGGLPDDCDDVAIVRSIVAMAHQLGLIVAAEGVETEEQRDFLASDGCDELQGYLLGRPTSAADAELLFDAAT
jgi:EAL domain-containing protein (putative c-di-GMP-specific phosphodiesterase class I)